MWMPTHVQVTVQRSAGLLTKGKNGTNDCFVTIALGKTKYQTSIKEKSGPDVEWHEECDLPIPDQGNTAEIVLTALHHNNFGIDEFLGRTVIPLNSLDIYERPKNKWYALESKPGKTGKAKERGHLEVKVGFTVKSGSLTDLSKKEKHKSSIGQLTHVAHSVGGSLLSLGSAEKRKGIKKFAKSIGSRMHLKGKKKDNDLDDNFSTGSAGSLKRQIENMDKFQSKQTKEDADPGVVSEDEDEFAFDDLSHKSSVSSLSQPAHQDLDTSLTSVENMTGDVKKTPSPVVKSSPNLVKSSPKVEKRTQDEWESKLFGKNTKNSLKPTETQTLNRRSWDLSKIAQIEEEEPVESVDIIRKNDASTPSPKSNKPEIKSNKSPELIIKEERDGIITKLKNFRKEKMDTSDTKRDKSVISASSERIIIGGENELNMSSNNRVTNEIMKKFEGKSREEIILLACDLQADLDSHKKKLKDLEDYLDDLLLRVMETTPRILQNPYVTSAVKCQSVS